MPLPWLLSFLNLGIWRTVECDLQSTQSFAASCTLICWRMYRKSALRRGLPILQIPVIIFIQQHTVNKRTCHAVSATDVQYKDVRVKDKTVIDTPEIRAMPFMQAAVWECCLVSSFSSSPNISVYSPLHLIEILCKNVQNMEKLGLQCCCRKCYKIHSIEGGRGCCYQYPMQKKGCAANMCTRKFMNPSSLHH